jgi:hypothetical protein
MLILLLYNNIFLHQRLSLNILFKMSAEQTKLFFKNKILFLVVEIQII